MMNASTCRVCGAGIEPKTTGGRPPTFCSVAFRRVAEFEIRRINRTLERLEDRALWLRDPHNPGLGDKAVEAAFVAGEIASATGRLRKLLGDER